MLYVCISVLCILYVMCILGLFVLFSFAAFFLQYFDTVGWVFWPV